LGDEFTGIKTRGKCLHEKAVETTKQNEKIKEEKPPQ
jgi:hypothetical protein